MASDFPDDLPTISGLSKKERKDLRRRGLLPLPPSTESYYRSQAHQTRELELRVAVLKLYRKKKTPTQIAQELGITRQKVLGCRRISLRESARRAIYVEQYGYAPQDVPPRKDRPHLRMLVALAPPKPYVPRRPPKSKAPPKLYVPYRIPKLQGSCLRSRCGCEVCVVKRYLSLTGPLPPPPPPPPPPPSSSSVSGEILDSPEAIQMRHDCLMLRKAMKPFDQMADFLGITEQEARQYTYEALSELQKSERNNADLERRLMIEQIDQMIAAIHPMSTGIDLQHGRRPVVLEAIDRMLKLMKQKAELLGLTEPPAIDIRLKLQEMAAEGEYDIVDLEEVARQVLARHKIRLPEF